MRGNWCVLDRRPLALAACQPFGLAVGIVCSGFFLVSNLVVLGCFFWNYFFFGHELNLVAFLFDCFTWMMLAVLSSSWDLESVSHKSFESNISRYCMLVLILSLIFWIILLICIILHIHWKDNRIHKEHLCKWFLKLGIGIRTVFKAWNIYFFIFFFNQNNFSQYGLQSIHVDDKSSWLKGSWQYG